MVNWKFPFSILCILLLVSITGIGQKKFIQSFDPQGAYQNKYLNAEGDGFEFESNQLKEKVDITTFNAELIEAAVLGRLNVWRSKSNRGVLVCKPSLQSISQGYVSRYGKTRFENSAVASQKMKLFLKKVPKYMELDFTYLEGAVGLVEVVENNRRDYFYSTYYQGSEVNLYAGTKSRVDSLHPAIPLHLKTYDQLVNEIMKLLTRGRYARYTKSKAFDLVGVSVRVASFSTKRINQVKFILLIGGYRNKYILPEEE